DGGNVHATMAEPQRDAEIQAGGETEAETEPEPANNEVDPGEVTHTAAPHGEPPNWHSGWVKTDAPAPPAAETAKPRFVPEQPDMPPPPQASAEQRMKLARAFRDIGDDHPAKELLRELLDGPDPALRNEAAKMLRELG